MEKTYYFPNSGNEEEFFCNGAPWVCLNYAALEEFSRDTETPLNEIGPLIHEATTEELDTYGVYNGDAERLERSVNNPSPKGNWLVTIR